MVSNITLTHPEIVLQWHHIKNKNLKPNQFTHGSHKIVWWDLSKYNLFCSSPPKKNNEYSIFTHHAA